MKATVIEVRSFQFDRPHIRVQLRGGDMYNLYTRFHPELYESLNPGDIIEVAWQTNNPYIVPVEVG